jgi:hypothetical protein
MSTVTSSIASPTASAANVVFERDGCLTLSSLTTAGDIELIRSLLDPLFDRFDTLGERAVDLAGPCESGVPLRSPEVNEAVRLEPRLRSTLAYARCRHIASMLLGTPVGYQFDHAIFKPPVNQTATAWHQDEAYSTEPMPLRSVHFWIPLQPVTVENGCMWFVPGSNQNGLLPHYVASRRFNGAQSQTTAATLATKIVDESKAVACPLPLGGATVHHPLTLHYTGPNQTDAWRKAWILHFGAYGWVRRRMHPRVLAAKIGVGTHPPRLAT